MKYTKRQILETYFSVAAKAERYLNMLDSPNMTKIDREEITHLLNAYNKMLAFWEDRHPWIADILQILDKEEG